jgi:hypothetical protein
MGLFDEVRCEYPLPNAAHQGLLFQTKDLDNILAEYRITRRGRLVQTKGGWFAETRRRLSCPIHQDLRIYTSVEVGSEEHEWVEYVFRFTEGRVSRVRRTRDRHRFKVKTWDPGERKATATETTLPTGEPEGRLRPGPAPRRPTVDEFHAHAGEAGADRRSHPRRGGPAAAPPHQRRPPTRGAARGTEGLAERSGARAVGAAPPSRAGDAATMSDPRHDDSRAAEVQLLGNLRAREEDLRARLSACSDHWGFEDPVYRFYHQSFKVFWLQQQTETLVRLLTELARTSLRRPRLCRAAMRLSFASTA